MKQYLGVEFGSTRIKAVLIDEKGTVLSGGSYEWENTLVDGYWSYALSEVWRGLQTAYSALSAMYAEKFGAPLDTLDGIGISAMMHGYLAFDAQYDQLVPFRTWRNTRSMQAADELSRELDVTMPQRWCAAHYYQAVLNGESHVRDVAHLHTLSSYVHYMLTGNNVVGIGDASGMFPIADGDYDRARIEKYDRLLARHGVRKDMYALLPSVLPAGENAGTLTAAGARLLDVSGRLQAGIPFCPPEGDMGTGMIATNSVRARTANVSSGTSVNLTVILERPLKNRYREIDEIAAPDGSPAALVHANNCTNEINAWVRLFAEVAELCGAQADRGALFTKLFEKSRESGDDCGKLVGYNFLAGEPLAGTETGAPLVLRAPDGQLDLADFMQMQIYSAVSVLALGMDILYGEGVGIDSVTAHGGFYKTEFVGQNATAAVLNAPVTVMKNAGEGGAWGIALLALYAGQKKGTLAEFLDTVFRNTEKVTVTASEAEMRKCAAYLARYKQNLPAAQAAARSVMDR